MQIEMWSDIVCPWCYIGKRRFEAALAQFPHRSEVEVIWRSFEWKASHEETPIGSIDPNASEEGDTCVPAARQA